MEISWSVGVCLCKEIEAMQLPVFAARWIPLHWDTHLRHRCIDRMRSFACCEPWTSAVAHHASITDTRRSRCTCKILPVCNRCACRPDGIENLIENTVHAFMFVKSFLMHVGEKRWPMVQWHLAVELYGCYIGSFYHREFSDICPVTAYIPGRLRQIRRQTSE